MKAERLLIAALLLAFAPAAEALADGCYVPERAVAVLPKIPVQRAVISFRKGRETLIVESAVEGKGKRFGWIVPVPAKPESIKACTPGTLKSFAMALQPKIVHDLSRQLGRVIWLAVVVITLSLVWSSVHRAGKQGSRPLWHVLAFAVFFLVVTALALPAGMASRRSGASLPAGVTVVGEERVGSYQVTVVSAADAEALYAWLRAEDFAVPAEFKSAVADYVGRGWVFATAKLSTDGNARAVPHPLSITFPTDRAVYPMKLTGLSGADLDLELYVVGEEAASAPGMRRVFCDRFRQGLSYDFYWMHAGMSVPDMDEVECYRGAESGATLGHPSIIPVLWNGCCVSKLTGTIPPSEMTEDYDLTWSPASFERQTLWSNLGASMTAAMVAILIVTICLPIALVMRARERMSRRAFLCSLLGIGAAALLSVGAIKLVLPQVKAASYGGKGFRAGRSVRGLLAHLQDFDRRVRVGDVPWKSAAASLRKRASCWNNLYTGELMREEDSPGNFLVSQKDGKLSFTFYDIGGTPVTVLLGETR